MYENFSALSIKSLDSIFNRLQKIVSQLAVLGEFISQEGLNLKFLRSLPSEWNIHVVVWRNKPDLDTMSLDDLYNNFKIVEQEVKGTANTASTQSSIASTQVSTASSQTSTANLSNATIYAFLANQSNGSQLVDEDLKQIHEDDLDKMDLKWQLALLSMRAKRFFQKTRKKITINGSSTTGFDKSKVDYYNFHKMGHFVRDCRRPRNQDSKNSYMAEDEVPTNMALMAFLDWRCPPPKTNLSYSGLEEFKQPQFESYRPKSSEIESKTASEDIPNKHKEYTDALLVKDRVLDNKDCSVESPVVVEKKFVVPTIAKVEFVKPKQQENQVRKPVKYAEMYREKVVSGNNYTRVTYNNSTRKTHPGAHRKMAPRAVLMKTSLRPLNTTRPVNTAHPKTIVYSARPMPKAVNTARPKAVNTARPSPAVVNAGHPQKVLYDQGYFDSECSRHMEGNMSYLSDFKEFNRGYVTFGGGANSGRITGKGTIKTDNLDFKDVYFVKELKFNLFSVSQMCNRKNNVLFTDTECLVSSSNFKALVVKPHNKTPYELFRGRTHALSFMRPFGCHVTILNTFDHLDKFNGKADEGYFVRYSLNCKAFRVYNIRTRRVEENLHIEFLENKPIVAGAGPKWLFDIDMLTKLMNYVPVIVGFMVYQMDVKSAFLYRRITEEVYVCQPLRFKDPDHPDKVYKVVKALYGLYQASRAWYEALAKYLLGNRFHRGKIDQTLFIKRQKGDIFLVQVYVDDIIIGFTKKELCTEFEWLMKDKFQMSSMGELTFFLGFQVKQKEDGIFISQDKYVTKVLRKFNFLDVKSASTPVDMEKTLVKDANGDDVDVHLYRSMIRSLMYLTTSRPDIMYATCCKKQTVVATSTTEAKYVAAASCCGQVLWIPNQMLDYRRHFKLEDSNGISTLPTIEIFEHLALMGNIKRASKGYSRMDMPFFSTMLVQGLIYQDEAASSSVDVKHRGDAITVTSLDAGQGSGNINKTPFMPYDLPIPRVHTLGSDEGRTQHNELMDFVTKLPNKVVALEMDLKQTKKVYGAAYTKLIMKVKMLKKTVKTSQARKKAKIIVSDDEEDLEDPSKQGKKIDEIDQDPNILLIQLDAEIQGSIAKPVSTVVAVVTTTSIDVSPASPTRRVSTADDITMAKTLVYIRTSAAKDKGKSIMTESEPVQTKTKLQQEQKRLGYEVVVRLQEELDEEER
uniref:Putative ribonuclease H-like domain-containing protein n=1 Tax=Tanacetum cinerariifolium TaxID=118510 RepID=A0A6L2LM11_TANCI|nr:putative ribonuclease H-like domain-containing protein [Tanacetum cinerariifolium]